MSGSGRYHGTKKVKAKDSMSNETSEAEYKIEARLIRNVTFSNKEHSLGGVRVYKGAIADLTDKLHDENFPSSFIEHYGLDSGVRVIEDARNKKKYIALKCTKKPNSKRTKCITALEHKRGREYNLVELTVTLAMRKREVKEVILDPDVDAWDDYR